MKIVALTVSLLFACSLVVYAQTQEETSPPAELTYTDAFVLGVVEGITEYLPISSTGHLILANRLLGLDSNQPMVGSDGMPLMIKLDDGNTEPYTLKHAADAYAIVIQGGAILAVLILYWRRIWNAARGTVFSVLGWVGKKLGDETDNRNGLLLTRNLIAAFMPAAILGLLLEDLIDSYLFGTEPVIIALIAGSFLMFGVEAWRRNRSSSDHEGPDLHELSIQKCLLVGLLQCVAMWPGTSRSMMTIVGGYIVGLSPVRSAEFSFLLGLITLSAASGWKLLKPYLTGDPTLLEALAIGPVVFGIVVATIAAALAVQWLVSYLTKHGLSVFAWYRLVLAGGIALYLYVF